MPNYVLVYRGGGMPESDAEREAQLAAWSTWFGNLGQAVVDAGNPFGAGTAVTSDGAVGNEAASGLTGYSILATDSLSDAAELAKGCPILAGGGSIDLYETHQVS